jgi:hypothetical protein
MLWLLAFSLVTGLPPQPPSQPGFIDAPRLAALCGAGGPEGQSARSLCLGYVVGSVDQLMASQARRGRATVCPPKDLTAEDAMKAVVRRSRYASTATGLGAAGFVRFALEDAYPCPLPVGPR